VRAETDKRKIALMQLVEDEKLYCGLLTSIIEVSSFPPSANACSLV
jgi:hypothetical protein